MKNVLKIDYLTKFLKRIFKKQSTKVVIALLLGVVIGGIVVHIWDQEELWLNRRAVRTIVLTSNKLFTIDSEMLDADSTSFQILAGCISKPEQCASSKNQSDLKKSIDVYNGLIEVRKSTFTQLNLLYKQFQIPSQ